MFIFLILFIISWSNFLFVYHQVYMENAFKFILHCMLVTIQKLLQSCSPLGASPIALRENNYEILVNALAKVWNILLFRENVSKVEIFNYGFFLERNI